MATYQERYQPTLMAANATVRVTKESVGGFLAATAGTITIVSTDNGTVVLAHPVAAGTYYPFPFYLGPNGGSVTLAGGASGTLGL